MYTNAGIDRAAADKHNYKVERDARRAAMVAGWERAAERGDQPVEWITPEMGMIEGSSEDGTARGGRGQYTYDPQEEKGFDIHNALRVKPKQYVVHQLDTIHVDGSITPAGTLEKELTQPQLAAIGAKKFCLRCEDRQPDDPTERKRMAQRLTDLTGYNKPTELKWDEVCVYCGAILGFSGRRAKAS